MHDFVTDIWISTVFEMVENRSRSCRTGRHEIKVSVSAGVMYLTNLASRSLLLRTRTELNDLS